MPNDTTTISTDAQAELRLTIERVQHELKQKREQAKELAATLRRLNQAKATLEGLKK